MSDQSKNKKVKKVENIIFQKNVVHLKQKRNFIRSLQNIHL